MTDASEERWQVGDLTIDVGKHEVTRNGLPIELPQLSFRFLMALVRAAPRVLSTDDLMEQVWSGVFVNNETVTQRAKLLRDALGDNPREPRYFSVRRSAGYQLIPVPLRLDCNDGTDSRGQLRHRSALMAAFALAILSASGLAAMTVWSSRPVVAHGASLSVAVLPFDNLSSDPADAYIARSIPEMVLNRLSSVRGLTVISRESAFDSAASKASTREAGRQLGAGFLVKGSVQRAGETLRVTCFVVDATQGVRLWSERFDWPIDRLYALQDRIAEHVTSALEPRLRGLGELAPQSASTKNTDAYLAYLKGKSLLGRFTVAETDAAAAQFERAVALDPGFGDAMVALIDARMQGANLRKEDLEPIRARYQPLLDKALKLDPDSGSALFAKAMWSDTPDAAKEALFRRASELDPSNSRGLTAFSEFLDRRTRGQTGEQSKEGKLILKRVLAIDPLSPRNRFRLVQRQTIGLPPEQVEQAMKRELALDPQNYPLAVRYAKRRWMFDGETAEAIEEMERIIASDPQNPWGPQLILAYYLDVLDPAAARAVARTTPATRDSSRLLLSQYNGDWREAGLAALSRRGFLFGEFETWNWPEAVRDYALHTGNFDAGAEAIATRYGFDLAQPSVNSLSKATAAPALGQILLAKGDRESGTRLLASNVQWIDSHPSFGLGGVRRLRAASMMLLGQHDQALSDLKASIETGHDLRHWWYVIGRDPVWASVRDDPRFKEIAEFCRRAASTQRAKLDAFRRAGKVPARTDTAGS